MSKAISIKTAMTLMKMIEKEIYVSQNLQLNIDVKDSKKDYKEVLD